LEAFANILDSQILVELAQYQTAYVSISIHNSFVLLLLFPELSAAECNDLKLLLRLPWSRFQDLRTFLANKGIKVVASEPKMREELKSKY